MIKFAAADPMFVLDKSRVPTDRREDPRLEAIEMNCCEVMQDPKYRVQVCVHEAAHAIYLRRAGATQLVYHGPVVLYDASKDEFEVGTAGIQGTFPSEGVDLPLRVVARWHVAGGIAKRLLTDASDAGDEQDFEVFTGKCGEGISEKEIQQVWEVAKKDVEKDLRSPSFRQEVWKLAREFERWLLEERND
jgi:hypothetical protein